MEFDLHSRHFTPEDTGIDALGADHLPYSTSDTFTNPFFLPDKVAAQTDESPPAPHIPAFRYDDGILESLEQQLEQYRRTVTYQTAPSPSMDDVPLADIAPTFNPTHAPDEVIQATGRVPRKLKNTAPHSIFYPDAGPVVVWRIVTRQAAETGAGLVSSRVQRTGGLGDVEGMRVANQFASRSESRLSGGDDTDSPFLSCSTDPEDLAQQLLRSGFSISEDHDSVVMKCTMSADRVITKGWPKEREVVVLGGIASHEYQGAYSARDFIARMVPADAVITLAGSNQKVRRDEAFKKWTGKSLDAS